MSKMLWQDLGAAVALVLVLEGILPFLNPRRYRDSVTAVTQFSDRTLRSLGFASMFGGILVLYIVRS